ncbi:MAG TPA: cobalamin-dependent protein [Kribbellaceae bacterium]|nr:cobalamin-dependent protein [Kribbellaceae bacterium]
MRPLRIAPQTRPDWRAGRLNIVIGALSSDAHTWNLVFLQLLLEELGHRVRNLGPCVPDEVVVQACREHPVDLLLVTSINGHGVQDGKSLIRAVRNRPELASVPVAIGGLLDTDGTGHRAELLDAGFDAVFEGGAGTGALTTYLGALCSRSA